MFMIWISCALLYVGQISPATFYLYNLGNGAEVNEVWAWIGACCTLWQWVIASLGYIGIVYVMFSGARRLELRQNETYGKDPEFQAYIKKTPIILPLIPIYSVARHSWLKG